MDRRSVIVLAVLLFIAFLGWDLRYKSVQDTVVVGPIRKDALNYYSYAYNLRYLGTYSNNHEGIEDPKPDALSPPGYPIFLMPFVGKDPPDQESLQRIYLAQAFISLLTVFFAFGIYRGFLPTRTSLLAAFLTSISPHLVTANVFILTESLFCFCLVFTFWVVRRFIHNNKLFYIFLACAALGMSALVRPASQYFFILLMIFVLWWLPRNEWKRILLVGFVGYLLLVGPWMVRNSGLEIDSSRLAVMRLAAGIYPGLMYQDQPESYGHPYRVDPEYVKISRSKESVCAEIYRRFTEEPGRHLYWYFIGKPMKLWEWNMVTGNKELYVYPVRKSPYKVYDHFIVTHRFMKIIHAPLVMLCLIGVIIVWLPVIRLGLSREAIMMARCLSLFLLYFTALHMVASPFPRYSVPVRPFMYGMAMIPLLYTYNYIVTCVNADKINKQRQGKE
jgi:4-amino-4-deoxy-L-arabinose transferase-like glycosyltransferase